MGARKERKAFFTTTQAVILIISSCLIIGSFITFTSFFTTKTKDNLLIDQINRDKKIIQTSTRPREKRIKNIVDLGVFFISRDKNDDIVYVTKPNSASRRRLYTLTQSDATLKEFVDLFAESKNSRILESDNTDFKNVTVVKKYRIWESLGDSISFRLLPVIYNISQKIKNYVSHSSLDENEFCAVFVEKEIIRVMFCENCEDSYQINGRSYFIKSGKYPDNKSIMQYILFKMF